MDEDGGDGARPPDQDGEEGKATREVVISNDSDDTMRMEVVESTVVDNSSKSYKRSKKKVKRLFEQNLKGFEVKC